MTTLTWESASDWDSAQNEYAVVHEANANRDYNDASVIRLGLPAEDVGGSALEHFYPLEEDSGGTANDLAGATNGSYNGAGQGSSGPLGVTSYFFDGSDDRVDFGTSNPPNLSRSSPHSQVALVNASSSGGKETRMVFPGFKAKLCEPGGNGNWGVVVYDGNTNPTIEGLSITTGEWAAVGLSYDPNNQIRFVANGTDYGTTSVATASDSVSDAGLAMSQIYNGYMAQVQFYSRALSATELKNLTNVLSQGLLTTAKKTS